MTVLDRFRLDGKRLFITGGSRGLGREMSLAIAEAGADVVMVGRDADSLAATAADICARGRQCWTLTGDAGTPEGCERACAEALALGPIDILINNIGGRRINVPVEAQSLADWQAMIDLNLTSTFLCTKLVGGQMVARTKAGEAVAGRVINIASMSGLIANRGIGGRHYEAAKAAVIHFTKAVAADWAPHRVTVNAILPGFFMTEPNKRWARENPAMVDNIRDSVPIGEAGQPEDLGPLAVYLASDAARYMTGSALLIDGGYTIW
ncbi:MAG: SDR family NAD(P)-dependent oxidoreductase [Alphaproteobacteria bacterium]|jgi:NAD(P)-dependent dehydrogenase (short-subunit alcohol dehydrogenase family)|nr:SDR family NAD(P)-dependent oxidoreductase [Alphaproteobacteria bacterium]